MSVEEEIGEMIKVLGEPQKTEPITSPEPEPKVETGKEETNGTGSITASESNPSSESVDSKAKVEETNKEGREGVDNSGSDTTTPTSVVVSSSSTGPKLEEPKPVITEVKVEPKVEPKLEPLAEQDFIGDLDLDDLGRDPKEFNKILNKVYQKAAEDVRKGILTEIPDVVKNTVTVMETLKKTTEEFYTSNTDLKPFKKVVATVFDELAAANPDKTYDKVIELVAPEVRKRLELPVKKVEVQDDKTKKTDSPKLPKTGSKTGRSQEVPKIDPLQAELEEMNKTLGR